MVKNIEVLISEIIEACGEDGSGCTAERTEALVVDFFANVTAECSRGGDVCDITFTDPFKDDAKPETETMCFPKECHDEDEEALKFLFGEEQEVAAEEGDAVEPVDESKIED